MKIRMRFTCGAVLAALIVASCDVSEPTVVVVPSPDAGEPPAATVDPTETPERPVPEPRFKNIEIALPEGEPVAAAVPDGRYVLSIRARYSNGFDHSDRIACVVSTEADSVRIEPERPGYATFTGKLEGGRLTATGVENGARLELAGQVTGEGRIAGTAQGAAGEIRITDGRWSLQLVAAKSAAGD